MQHIVVFKFDPAKFEAEFPGNALQEGVESLRKAAIPGLLEINMGAKNITAWEGYQDATHGYTHALVSRHKDAASLHIYADHPVHKALQARFIKCVAAPPLRMELDVYPANL
ncbi:hypothetical protein ABB37_04290 [Leptomonas pyrrhocoris]|uniref:Stress-response A/B barrel domain-containing protein n=1 Tax=Leptomonas pyrrhocoris TaxID=157538 RepID=A0A0N0VFG0_LEPPY|nr:hypothetical protein ABB37_04290 [Leptomonas pyrrhocoris]KPA80878.1 hypothetical protein ABB37_04290 [Leptomonas pyrrhocoris]|eukprot:XP_015659317.1 hypothetical protein ABB37_04290 [Leptomonas pyrrhocoris]